MWKYALPLLFLYETTLDGQGSCSAGVQVSPTTVTRNSSFRVTITPPPKITIGKIAFVNSDRARAEYDIALDGGSVSYTVPPSLPLGSSRIEIQLGGTWLPACDLLKVAPATGWQLALTPFQPPGTSEVKAGRVQVTLRGTGFDTGRPADNRIFIMDAPLDVKWQSPDPNQKDTVFGQVVSGDRIDLWNVPVPPHERLAFKIKQGDLETRPQTFRVFLWSFSKPTVGAVSAIIALAMGLAVLGLIKLLLSKQTSATKHSVLDTLFMDPETDTYSLSKFQFYCWTVAAVFGYSYLVIGKMIVQGLNWPDIPSGLPAIILVGAGTSVGAQFVSNVRGPKGSGAERPTLGDLVTSGGVAAPERVQFFVWTIIGVAVFCISVVKYSPDVIQALDPVPDGLLMMMGVSSAGYLGGKLARKPGPVINEISVTPSESDEAIAKEAAAPQAPPNLSGLAAQAKSVLQSLTGVTEGNGKTAIDALGAACAAAADVKTARDGETALVKLTDQQRVAESAATAAAAEFALPGAPPTASRAAEIAQSAAAAVQDLALAATALVSASLAPPVPGGTAPQFSRRIEIRGQNLSSEARFEIDGVELPFSMLQENDGKRLPEVVIREQDNPTLARLLRLSLDPAQLEAADFRKYKQWFGTSDTRPKTFTMLNPDGQKSDRTFTIPPVTAPSPATAGQPVTGSAPKEPGK